MIEFVVSTVMLLALIAPWVSEIPTRLTHFREGVSGIKYTPLVWLAVVPASLFAHALAQYAPVLQWGWIGHNILVTPFAGESQMSASGGYESTSEFVLSTAVELTPVVMFVGMLFLTFIVFNFEEEEWGRESWWHVLGWAVSHLIMGIPLFAVIPIFAAGCVFKLIYDSHGHQVAFATHVTTNTGFAVMLAMIFVVT